MSADPDLNRPFAENVARRLRDAGHEALFAGGCVRDLLLSRTPKDYDVATSARPEQVRALFGHKRTLAVGASFGVVIIVPSKAGRDAGVEPVEVATFRTEGPYLDGRRPENVAFATAEEDAKRRDFTINGMFLDPIGGDVLDFVGGREDLATGVIRAIGDPRERMAEDKLRLLRAARFAATLGFRLDEATADAIREMASELTVVSAERIAQELRRMLVHPNRRRAVELCDECRLLEVILPECACVPLREKDKEKALRILDRLNGPSFEAALAAVFLTASCAPPLSAAKAACRRLRLSNAETERVVWLVEHADSLRGLHHAPPSRLKRLCAHPGIGDLIVLVRAAISADGEDPSDLLSVESFLSNAAPEEIDPVPLLTGKDLIGLGLKPGPAFKRILDVVRDAQLDGAITTPVEAADLAGRLHADGPRDTK